MLYCLCIRQVRVGDFIETSGIMGVVKEIGIFSTLIFAPDNKKIIVPNAKLSGGVITNYSDVENRRVDMTFGIAYGDDVKKAKDVLLGLVEKDPRVLKDPAPFVGVSELGDSSINIVCRPYVKPENYWGVFFDLNENGMAALEQAGCSIPFPQMDVHLDKNA